MSAREDAQSRISGRLVARMIVDFHSEFRGTYPPDVLASSLCAVGPLQSMIGLAIKNGVLSLPKQDGELDAETVERCVQVADDHGKTWGLAHSSPAIAIASAIRSLTPGLEGRRE